MRAMLWSNHDKSSPFAKMEGSEKTERWLRFVATYLEHGGGIDEG